MIPDRLIIVGLVFVACGLGFGRILRERRHISDRCILAVEYWDYLKIYVQSRGNDSQAYAWLIRNSNKMQMHLGANGIYAAYRPPHANFQYANYPIILNMLPDLRNALEDTILCDSDLVRQYSMALQDTLGRHVGSLEDADELNAKALRNPVIWMREGARVITAFPLTLLSWLGVISERSITRFTSGRVFRVISSAATLVGFISAMMGIILGWEQFVQMATHWFKFI